MIGRKKEHKPGFCEVCNAKIVRKHTDKLCKKCFLEKRQKDRQKPSISEHKIWF